MEMTTVIFNLHIKEDRFVIIFVRKDYKRSYEVTYKQFGATMRRVEKLGILENLTYGTWFKPWLSWAFTIYPVTDSFWKQVQAVAYDKFTGWYVENMSKKQRTLWAKTLGIMVSHLFEWDGEEVAKWFFTALESGLEDSNWHAENEKIATIKEQLESGVSLREALK